MGLFRFKSNLIVKLFFIFIISLLPVVWIIQNNVEVQLYAKKRIIETLQEEWNAKIDIEDSDLNLFTGTVVLKNGTVRCKKGNNSWWNFKSAYVKYSRLKYLFNNELSLKIIFNDISANSCLEDKSIKILDHLKNILAPSVKFVIDLNSIKIYNLKLNIFDALNKNNYLMDFHGRFYFKKVKFDFTKDFLWHGGCSLKNGYFYLNEQLLVNDIKGKSSFYQEGSDDLWNFKIDKKLKCLFFNKSPEVFSLSGEWGFFNRSISLKDENNLLDLKISSSKSNDIFIKGIACADILKQVYNFSNNKSLDISLTGFVSLDSILDLEKENFLTGYIKTEDLKIGEDFVIKSKIKFDKSEQDLRFNFSNNLFIKQLNKESKFDGNGIYKNNCFSGDYFFSLSHNNKFKKYNFNGNYFLNDKRFDVSGKVEKGSYLISGIYDPKFCFKKILYQTNGERLIDTKFLEKNKTLKGKIKYSFLRSFLPFNLKRNILGRNSSLFFSVEQNIDNKLNGSIGLKGGKLSFLGNYNPLKSAHCFFSFDYLKRKLEATNCKLEFFKGNIFSPSTLIIFNNNNFIDEINSSVKVSDFLINYKRDFYAIVDGDLLLSKKSFNDNLQDSFFKINGDLILKRSLFKEGDFSAKSNDLFFYPDFALSDPLLDKNNSLEIDLNIYSENPTKVKTSFIDANAKLNLRFYSLLCNHSLIMPKITGSIDIQKGILKFLKHKLYIYDGKVIFGSDDFNEAMIDLIAQNKIKKYLITLQATGPFNNPKFSLEASPNLLEEQILALLVSGSENATLQSDLPNIFMQNLNDLVMGNKNILPKGVDFFRRITLPFKYIQITPDFNNHSGGLKGTVSIDLNNQIHTQVQKNFNAQEDFSFQVEYLLTDDINFKFVRDHRGDIGSEVEVRFKL